MKSIIVILLLFFSIFSLNAQVWKYPKLPDVPGFDHLTISSDGKEIMHKDDFRLKGIKHSKLYQGYSPFQDYFVEDRYYDTLGRLIMTINDGDTSKYRYNDLHQKVYEKNRISEYQYHFTYNEHKQLVKVEEEDIINHKSTISRYEYNSHPTLPDYYCPYIEEVPCAESPTRWEKTFYDDERIKSFVFIKENQMKDSIFYYYRGDTIYFDECITFTLYDSLHMSCDYTYGYYGKHGLEYINMRTMDSDGEVTSEMFYKYDEDGRLIEIENVLSNGGHGKYLSYYDDEGYFSRGISYSFNVETKEFEETMKSKVEIIDRW